MPLLEVIQNRQISASIRLDEATEDTGPPTARAALLRRPLVVPDAFVEPGLERWRPSILEEIAEDDSAIG